MSATRSTSFTVWYDTTTSWVMSGRESRFQQLLSVNDTPASWRFFACIPTLPTVTKRWLPSTGRAATWFGARNELSGPICYLYSTCARMKELKIYLRSYRETVNRQLKMTSDV